MTGKKKERGTVERLDVIGREVVRAASAEAREAEEVASSPFLYARLRSRIAAERVRREEGAGWLALLGIVWRAVPAMALVAVFAFALFLNTSPGAGVVAGFSDEALLDARDVGIEHVVFADTLSSDDVLSSIISEDAREASR